MFRDQRNLKYLSAMGPKGKVSYKVPPWLAVATNITSHYLAENPPHTREL